jgi:lysophospholipase L1-like esterase
LPTWRAELCDAFANGAAAELAALAAPVFALLAFFAVVLSARAETSEPKWREPASAARLVFTRPHQENFCLLQAPARLDAASVTDGRAWSDGNARPVRLVWADAANAFFLVDCRNEPEQQEVALYLLTNAVASLPEKPVADPLPVRFYAQRTAGQDLPATWEQLQILDTRVDRDPFYKALADFEAADGAPAGWYRGDWQRKNHLFQLSSWVLFPAAGRYAFSLRTEQPVWLTVDGARVLDHGVSRHAGWITAPPLGLAAGLHQVVARGVTRQDLQIAAEWTLKDRNDAPGVVAITGGEMVRARFERRDRRLHALAVATTAPPYAFEGVTNVFVPVRLESRSVSWDGDPLACAWRLDGRELGVGRVCNPALCVTSGAGRIELTVTDNHGHSAQDLVPVTLDGLPRMQYRVSGRLVGAPAIGYGDDIVRPEIHVRATSPDDVAFTVEAVLARAGGGSTNVAGRVEMARSWGRLVLPADTADAFDRIDWRVMHNGVVLDRGTTVFEHAPFRSLPDALDGDTLCAGSNALMLVARRASDGELPRFEGMRPGQRLLLLDGFLAPNEAGDTNLTAQLDNALSSSFVNKMEGGAPRRQAGLAELAPPVSGKPLAIEEEASPAFDTNRRRGAPPSSAMTNEAEKFASYRHVDLRALENNGCANGVARLQPLAQVASLLPADVVVVAPSFDALGQGETTAQFERRLAALAGLLCGPGHATVVLVTPPPFAILPGCEGLTAAGIHPPDARQLAEIVCRVADAYGLPVVDLYTGFMTAGDGAPLTCDGALTAAGMEQAVEALRRVLFEW